MAKIHFEKIRSELAMLNPYNNFAEELHTVEVRKDPLLGDVSVYNPFLRDKAKFFFGENDSAFIEKLVGESAKTCIFCGERIGKSTAKYRSDLIPEGRMTTGEATLFANLFSVGKYHPVISLSRAHFLKLSEFTPALLENGFQAAIKFLRLLYSHDPSSALYATINANYLLPAGASLVHPHLQMLVTPVAYSYQARLIDAGRHYFEKNGSSYFSDLCNQEKEAGVRYITQKGGWHWMTAFSPMGMNEVMAVHETKHDIGLLSETDIRDLAFGISRVLAWYESLGHLSFNYSLFSVRKSLEEEGFCCLLKMVTRQNLYPGYRNDDYFLQKMLQSELIFTTPEELALQLRGYF